MRDFRYVICDVFSERALEGNQLAVFTDASGLTDELMQALAREIGYSETVFVFRPAAGGHAQIRIFTPVREVPFAGHPVLGTAFVIGGSVQLDLIVLETKQGLVPVRLEREGSRPTFGWMDQPLPTIETLPAPEAVLSALGVARALSPIEIYDNGIRHAFVELESRAAVAGVRPDFARLAELGALGFSTFAGEGSCYKTRMFAPRAGVNEDPATGSAAGPLALHLARHGRIRFGDEIRIEQGAELGRPSALFARVDGSPERIERIQVGGAAVLVARGEFRLP
jgi:trans-2,3-dihydro-3-hydroxyanthranilate isomerase